MQSKAIGRGTLIAELQSLKARGRSEAKFTHGEADSPGKEARS